MKRINLLVTMCIMLLTAELNSQNLEISGGFGGAFSKTNLSNKSVSIGGGGAMLFNRNYFIGGYGQGTTDIVSNKSDLTGLGSYEIQSEYGGLWMGYILRTKLFDYTFSAKTGRGEVKLYDKVAKTTYYDDMFVFTPLLIIEKRVMSIFKIGLGVYYDFFSGVNLKSYNNRSFSHPGIIISINSGLF